VSHETAQRKILKKLTKSFLSTLKIKKKQNKTTSEKCKTWIEDISREKICKKKENSVRHSSGKLVYTWYT